MTDLEQNLLMDFKVKVKQIIAQHEALKQEKQLLHERIGDLEKIIDQLQQKNQFLEQKYENLKLAKVLAVADSDNKDAKNRIQKIVREIDKCIALLNK